MGGFCSKWLIQRCQHHTLLKRLDGSWCELTRQRLARMPIFKRSCTRSSAACNLSHNLSNWWPPSSVHWAMMGPLLNNSQQLQESNLSWMSIHEYVPLFLVSYLASEISVNALASKPMVSQRRCKHWTAPTGSGCFQHHLHCRISLTRSWKMIYQLSRLVPCANYAVAWGNSIRCRVCDGLHMKRQSTHEVKLGSALHGHQFACYRPTARQWLLAGCQPCVHAARSLALTDGLG